MIISLREEGEERLGNDAPCSRRIPQLNFEATHIKELIDWNKESIHGPPLTCHLTSAELREFCAAPMVVPVRSTHTQAVERVGNKCLKDCLWRGQKRGVYQIPAAEQNADVKE